MIEGTESATYRISVGGAEVTDRFSPYLMSLSLRLYDGGMADTLEIVLDDRGGQLKLPRVGAEMVLSLAWKDGDQALNFRGTTDEPRSHGSRQEGMLLSLAAIGVDFLGPTKQKLQGHADETSFADIAQKWGKKVGLAVQIDPALAKITRPYWSISNESFIAWGARIAKEIGATFKVFGTKAVFIPRNSGSSTSGQALASVTATWGKNLIYWDLSPSLVRPRYKKTIVWLYNPKTAKFEQQVVEVPDTGTDVSHVDARKFANKDQAKERAEANAGEIARGKGAGTVIIDGDPAAQPQASLIVSGVRPGIDGEYRITGVVHRLARSSGWLTEIEVGEPQGAAGEDAR